MSRIASALRELAAALEEAEDENWEVVDAPRAPRVEEPRCGRGPLARARALQQPSGARPSSSSATTPSALTAVQTDDKTVASRPAQEASRGGQAEAKASSWGTKPRHYLVLFAPHDRSLEGYWYGAWKDLQAKLPGGQLCGSLVQVKKVSSEVAAASEWAVVHPDRPMSRRTLP